MSEATAYEGSCHCGAVTFAANMTLETAMACNCSICRRAGWLLAFIPSADFELRSGADALQDYQFGKKSIHHYFCTTCGVRPFSRGTGQDGGETIAVNLRCIPDLDLGAYPVHEYDGASM